MVREGQKCSESVWRGLSIGHKCQNMCPEPGVAHQHGQVLPVCSGNIPKSNGSIPFNQYKRENVGESVGIENILLKKIS